MVWFILGCNFTHFDQPPFTEMTLEWEIMKNWPKFLWYAFGSIITFVFVNLAYLFYMYYLSGQIWEYIALTIGLFGFIIIKTYVLRDTHKLHLHHYTFGLIVLCYCGYQSRWIATLAAFFTGIMVEGACRWGFDPIWIPIGNKAVQMNV